ncbi:PAS domain S-box protein [Candidatus Woesearchaeota archaeon]|jgi:PAS domain S-box-containing protein|nr:PAS domain S-box protein [Candidatus Woesearchaeota archaeon]MBT3538326.1 PAS domain S-box protein [Candidatus Woesearchaeota archaeon]MBT4698303.1 PAS domain S-box protein [Candidatus Woesearchaeota archaeon]MBT4716798.1 PAS domain S-box protein [Candidatus Woesearchaeota archaeon]MBT7105995.1 PAS domain S-box protein [Candidatus Woesearchaeota archaeon]
MGDKEHIKEVIDSSSLGIISLDLDGRVLFCNQAFEKISSYSKEEIIDQNIFSLITAITKEDFKTIIKKVNKGEEISPIISKSMEHKSNKFDILYTINPRTENNQITGINVTFTNITNVINAKEFLGKIDYSQPRKKSFKELRARILISLLKKQMTINQVSTASNINWKTVEGHLTYLCGKGMVTEVFKSEYIRIFKITDLGKEYLKKIRVAIIEKYVSVLEDYPNILREEII